MLRFVALDSRARILSEASENMWVIARGSREGSVLYSIHFVGVVVASEMVVLIIKVMQSCRFESGQTRGHADQRTRESI
jgi:NO-binding membrane sensor protein with MHYT domain